MKKTKARLFSLLVLILIMCNNCTWDLQNTNDKAKNKFFVSLSNGKFKLEDNDFYPMILNYAVSLQMQDAECWPAPAFSYRSKEIDYSNKDSTFKELLADFELIKDMGFNTIRLVGIGEPQYGHDRDSLFFKTYVNNHEEALLSLNNPKSFSNYFKALENLFNLANKAGLKVIFLIRLNNEAPVIESYATKLMQHFKNDSTLLAYDLFNEPLYFDSLERDKSDVYFITKRWSSLIKENAPYQLSTIGLTGIREVFEWDPNLLNVDFLSIHPYEYEPEEVRNEIYWYGKYIQKPWIIGETAIPADNDSISYESQRLFAIKTMQQTYNCGGKGYSWWQFKDVEWSDFHANYLGVVSRTGTFTNSKGGKVYGSPKPVAEAFKNYKKNKGVCLCLENYYNYSNYKDCRLTGILEDQDGNAIEGGVIMAWNESWSKSFHTVTRENGTFELLGNFSFYHWKATATLHTMIRGEINPDTAKSITHNGIKTLDLGKLIVEKIEFD